MTGRQAKLSTRRTASRLRTQVMLSFLVIALVIGFALENSQPVTVDYLYATRDSRLAYVIFGSAMLGALADRLLVRRRRGAPEP